MQNTTSIVKNSLKGFAVGDGCVGTDVLCGDNGPGPLYMLKFIGGHGQMSDKLYNKIMDTCPYDQLVGYNGVQVTDPECKSLIAQAEKQMGGYYIYNLYDDCWYQNDLNPPSKSFDQRGRTWWGPPPAPMPHQIQSMLEGAENDYACGGPAAMFTWILNAEVKKALNV